MNFKIPDTPEELFRQGGNQFNQMQKMIPFAVIIVMLIALALTSFYSVDTDEVGVIRRFGQYVRTTNPGLHWKLPLGIEVLDTVKVTRVLKEEFGFRTLQPGVQTRYSNKKFDEESLMLTGDLNVIDVSWVVQYKVSDPVAYLFNIREQRDTVRDFSEAVMRLVIGDSSVSEALTTKKNEISEVVQTRLQEILDEYKSGIQIDKVELQDVNPPEQVKSSFNEVNEAEQEREQVINQAWEKYNKIIPKARGESERTIREAEGYAVARINQAQGDAAKFIETWNAYKEAKDVTRRRLYLETMQEVLPKAGKTYIAEPDSMQILPLLNLNQQ